MWDLTVSDVHTFAVGEGQWVVHNCAGPAGLIGQSDSYIDITRGSSVRNVGTNASHTEFSGTLLELGWTARNSKNGSVRIFERDGARYVLRSGADSYDGWSADFYAAGSTDITLKIRLGYGR